MQKCFVFFFFYCAQSCLWFKMLNHISLCCVMADKAGNCDKMGNLQQVGAVCCIERR